MNIYNNNNNRKICLYVSCKGTDSIKHDPKQSEPKYIARPPSEAMHFIIWNELKSNKINENEPKWHKWSEIKLNEEKKIENKMM